MLRTLLPVFVSLLSLLFGNDEADIVFAGDAMQHQMQLDAAHRPDGTYDYSTCFDSLYTYIAGADYAVANLETPLGSSNFTGYPSFNAPYAWGQALTDAGFDLLLTANNHTLDRRDRGLVSTCEYLDKIGVDHIGTYVSNGERSQRIPFVRDINNIRVGFLNYTYGTNGVEPGRDVVVDYIDRDKIRADIKATRDAGAELVCVCVHWGVEYVLLPNDSQRSLADFLQAEGVDMIIGGHPHVIQPMEMRHDDSTGRNTLVVYSLGNFISNMRTGDTRGGVMVRVHINRGADGRARVDRAFYLPIFTVAADGNRNYQVMPADAVDNPEWTGRRDTFLNAARRIFDKYNIGVHPEIR